MARIGSGGTAAGHRRAHQHRHAADLEVRHRGAEAALPRAGDPRREDRRARHHRAGRRLGRRRASRTRAERVDGGWVLNGEKTYITNGVRAHFIVTAVKTTARGRPPRHLLPDRRPRRGGQLLEARQARLARLRHRHDQLPGRVRAGGEPARRAQRGLQADHGQLPVGAPGDGARRRRRDAARLGAHRRVRPRAPRVRAPAVRPPGDPPQARRPRHLRLHAAAASPTTRCAASSPARSRCARSRWPSCSPSAPASS